MINLFCYIYDAICFLSRPRKRRKGEGKIINDGALKWRWGKWYIYEGTNQGIGAPQFEDMVVKMQNQPCSFDWAASISHLLNSIPLLPISLHFAYPSISIKSRYVIYYSYILIIFCSIFIYIFFFVLHSFLSQIFLFFRHISVLFFFMSILFCFLMRRRTLLLHLSLICLRWSQSKKYIYMDFMYLCRKQN